MGGGGRGVVGAATVCGGEGGGGVVGAATVCVVDGSCW